MIIFIDRNISLDIAINYHLDNQIILVVGQIYGPMLGAVARYSVRQDHTVQLQPKKFLAVVGIVFYLTVLDNFKQF